MQARQFAFFTLACNHGGEDHLYLTLLIQSVGSVGVQVLAFTYTRAYCHVVVYFHGTVQSVLGLRMLVYVG